MIATLRGHVLEMMADACILEVAGVGYLVQMPLSALEELRRIPGEALVYTYQYVREDTLALYGFLHSDEKQLFTQIIGVSGIGPKTALALLSVLPADRFRDAVRREDTKTLASAPGIGLKTAQRLVLELKSKIGKMPGGSVGSTMVEGYTGCPLDDVVAALTALGYPLTDALRVAEEVYGERPEGAVAEWIREALKRLAKK